MTQQFFFYFDCHQTVKVSHFFHTILQLSAVEKYLATSMLSPPDSSWWWSETVLGGAHTIQQLSHEAHIQSCWSSRIDHVRSVCCSDTSLELLLQSNSDVHEQWLHSWTGGTKQISVVKSESIWRQEQVTSKYLASIVDDVISVYVTSKYLASIVDDVISVCVSVVKSQWYQ